MTPPAARLACRVESACAPIVPAAERAVWLQQWTADLICQAAWLIDNGKSPAAARRDLFRRSAGAVRHACWLRFRQWRHQMIRVLLDDIHHAFRRLRSRPATAISSAVTLAFAVGVASATFTIADHLLMRSAPFNDIGRLVRIAVSDSGPGFNLNVTRAVAGAIDGAGGFADLQMARLEPAIIEGPQGLESISGARVSPGLFAMLGVAPILGRTFADGTGDAGDADTVVISETQWRTTFGADPTIVGRDIRLAGRPVRVIGVMPEGFAFPYWDTKIWRTFDVTAPPAQLAASRVYLYARVRAGARLADAAAAATRTAANAGALKPGERIILRGLTDGFVDPYSRTTLIVLSCGVGLVFLVLCANAASLILARAGARRVEYAIVAALGASRARIVRQALTETFCIGAAGAIAGLGLSWILTHAAIAALPESLSARTLNPIAIDARSVAAASFLGLVAALVAGLPPALLATRAAPSASLRPAARGNTEPRATRLARALLVGEVAFASALLVVAGILTASFVHLMQEPPGLDTTGVLTARVALPAFGFPDVASRTAAAAALHREVESMPGISAATLSLGVPPTGNGFSSDPIETDAGGTLTGTPVFDLAVGPDFFDVFGITLLEGRGFMAGDARDETVVSSGLAALLWPGESAIGRSFHYAGQPTRRVIGVAREVRSAVSDPTTDLPEYYVPLSPGQSQVMLGLRCVARCPGSLELRERLRAAVPGALVLEAGPMATRYAAQFDRPRAAATLAGGFAVVALLAAAGGLFSVLTHAVGRRRREFGVRFALGARPAQVHRLVLAEAGGIAVTGLAIGAAIAWASARWLGSLSYGLTISAPSIWFGVLATIAAVAMLAAWPPARAAARANPLDLLRND